MDFLFIMFFISTVGTYRIFKLFSLLYYVLFASVLVAIAMTNITIHQALETYLLFVVLPIWSCVFIAHLLSSKIDSLKNTLLKIDQKYEEKYWK